MPGRIALGDLELILVSDGAYRLDGGAYFGVVPKLLWSRKKQADEDNLIRVGLNCLLVRSGRRTVLVETGIGGKLDEKRLRLHGVERGRGLPEEIAAQGVDPDSIDTVINTHLHFDHCGGNTALQGGGVRPVFPRAQYYVQRGEWEHAHKRLERDAVSYLAENYDPLVESGQMTLLDGDREIAPGISVRVLPGHTRHMQAVLVRSQGRTCAFLSDLAPSTSHLNPTWVMAYDLFPLDTIESKKCVLAQAAAENWLCVFVHDAEHPWGYVRLGERGRYEFQEP
jgi:glyoxylase-like metal-dependent hydrolase (beta-lactamase superfamily II)